MLLTFQAKKITCMLRELATTLLAICCCLCGYFFCILLSIFKAKKRAPACFVSWPPLFLQALMGSWCSSNSSLTPSAWNCIFVKKKTFLMLKGLLHSTHCLTSDELSLWLNFCIVFAFVCQRRFVDICKCCRNRKLSCWPTYILLSKLWWGGML